MRPVIVTLALFVCADAAAQPVTDGALPGAESAPAALPPAALPPAALPPAALPPVPPADAETPPLRGGELRPPSRERRRTIGRALIGSGSAAVLAGAGFAWIARKQAREAESGNGTWDPRIERTGEHAEAARTTLWVGGGLAIAAGIALQVVGRSRPSTSTLAIVPIGDGAILMWDGAL